MRETIPRGRNLQSREKAGRDDRRVNELKAEKGGWWMPWLPEAMKDVISCEKPWVGANGL